VTVFAVAQPVLAQDDEAPSPEGLIDEGIALREQGRDEEALTRFERAWELGHAPRALTQVALAEQALGRWLDAYAHLEEALAATDDEWIAPRREVLNAELARIGERLGQLEIRGGVEGAEVRIDGREVGALPLADPVRVVAGRVTLEVVAEGYYPFSRPVRVSAGGLARETVELSPREAAGPDPVPEPEPDPDPDPTLDPDPPPDPDPEPVVTTQQGIRGGTIAGVALLAGAAVFGGVSVAMYVVREGRAETYNGDDCVSLTQSRGELCGDEYDGAIRAQRAAAATVGIAGALAIGGVVALLVGGATSEEEETAVRCGPAGLGVSCGGRF